MWMDADLARSRNAPKCAKSCENVNFLRGRAIAGMTPLAGKMTTQGAYGDALFALFGRRQYVRHRFRVSAGVNLLKHVRDAAGGVDEK